MNQRPLSLHDFKSWLSKEPDLSEFFDLLGRDPGPRGGDLVGRMVVAKVGAKKLRQRIRVDEGDPDVLVDELMEGGGTILDLDGKDLLIEVESGSLFLPRFCVRLVDPH